MTTETMTVEQLVAVGGSEWQRGDKHRVYFNDLASLYGLEVSRYNTGNISGARLNGEEISNGQARKLISTLQVAKLWWDVPTGKFMVQGMEAEMSGPICAEIRRRVAEMPESEPTPTSEEPTTTTQLPEMTGDAQRVGWAMDRREKLIAELDETIARYQAQVDRGDDEEYGPLLAHAQRGREMMLAHTDAAWWMQNSALGANRLLIEVAGTVRNPNY